MTPTCRLPASLTADLVGLCPAEGADGERPLEPLTIHADRIGPKVSAHRGRKPRVTAFNQRSVAAIIGMIRTFGAMLDVSEQARQLVATLETYLAEARSRADRLPKRPKVFFEEWEEPLISGIGWVSELVEIAGGIDIFADRRYQGAAKALNLPVAARSRGLI